MSAADEDLAPDQPIEYPGDCCKAAGDSEAEFIRQLTGAQCSLRGYILALLGGQKKEADDVLQDTNVAIWEKRTKYDNTPLSSPGRSPLPTSGFEPCGGTRLARVWCLAISS